MNRPVLSVTGEAPGEMFHSTSLCQSPYALRQAFRYRRSDKGGCLFALPSRPSPALQYSKAQATRGCLAMARAPSDAGQLNKL